MTEESRLPQSLDPADVGPQAEAAAAPDVYGAGAASSLVESSERMSSLIGRLADVAKAEAAVGPAQTVQGRTMVPLATVSVRGGFGMGFGGGGGTAERRNSGGGSGGGAGGGGRSSARVIAIVEVSEHGVEVKPVLDVTAIVLAGIALAGLRMVTRGRGGGRGAARGRLLRMLRRD